MEGYMDWEVNLEKPIDKEKKLEIVRRECEKAKKLCRRMLSDHQKNSELGDFYDIGFNDGFKYGWNFVLAFILRNYKSYIVDTIADNILLESENKVIDPFYF